MKREILSEDTPISNQLKNNAGFPKKEKSTAIYQAKSPLEAVLYEVVRLFHRLRFVMEELHQQGELSSGKGGILKGLDRHGPQTVPQMARARPVSRQYIQTLVNPLLEGGFVELVKNPAHKKSFLVSLTAKGKELVRDMRRREVEALEGLDVNLSEEELESVEKVLRTLRHAFESAA